MTRPRSVIRRELEVAASRHEEATRVTDAFKVQLAQRKRLGRSREAVDEALAQVGAAEDAEVLAWQEWNLLREELAEAGVMLGVSRG